MVEPLKEGVTQMRAPESMVKIKVNYPISVKRDGIDVIFQPGQIAEVTEPEAQEFADKTFVGPYTFSGEHEVTFSESTRYRVKRADRLPPSGKAI